MKEEFLDYIQDFEYKKVRISELYDNFNTEGEKPSKKMFNKWLKEIAEENGFKLVSKISSNVRYHDFIKLTVSFSEKQILELEFNSSLLIDNSEFESAKSIVKKLKYKTNNRYKVNQFNNETRIFRIA